jgi:hypothetical protein
MGGKRLRETQKFYPFGARALASVALREIDDRSAEQIPADRAAAAVEPQKQSQARRLGICLGQRPEDRQRAQNGLKSSSGVRHLGRMTSARRACALYLEAGIGREQCDESL